MAHTHEYDCIVCGAHFDSSADLTRHNDAAHLSTATGMERPRSTATSDHGGKVTGAAHEHDRNPGQGFQDPRADRSDKT